MRRKIKAKLTKITSKMLLVIVFGGCGLASCTYYTNEYSPVPDNVGFNEHVIPIFDRSCNVSGCHSSGGILPDLTSENAYINLIGLGYVNPGEAAEDSGLYNAIDGGSMKSYATDEDRAIIKKWIDDGAEDN